MNSYLSNFKAIVERNGIAVELSDKQTRYIMLFCNVKWDRYRVIKCHENQIIMTCPRVSVDTPIADLSALELTDIVFIIDSCNRAILFGFSYAYATSFIYGFPSIPWEYLKILIPRRHYMQNFSFLGSKVSYYF